MVMCCRPSANPGPVPDELVVPVIESIGMSINPWMIFERKLCIVTLCLLAVIS